MSSIAIQYTQSYRDGSKSNHTDNIELPERSGYPLPILSAALNFVAVNVFTESLVRQGSTSAKTEDLSLKSRIIIWLANKIEHAFEIGYTLENDQSKVTHSKAEDIYSSNGISGAQLKAIMTAALSLETNGGLMVIEGVDSNYEEASILPLSSYSNLLTALKLTPKKLTKAGLTITGKEMRKLEQIPNGNDEELYPNLLAIKDRLKMPENLAKARLGRSA